MGKMTLEKLLNILLERGWKPWNREKTLHICCYDKCKWMDYQWVHLDGWFMNEDSKKFRELVSKESWLWQFCEENWMIDWHKYDSKTYEVRIENWIKRREVWPEWEVSTNESWRPRHSAEYRLIEASLKNEDELEQFLLENIKIDE